MFEIVFYWWQFMFIIPKTSNKYILLLEHTDICFLLSWHIKDKTKYPVSVNAS